MKFKFKQFFFYFLLIFIIVVSLFIYYNLSQKCSELRVIDSSITVKSRTLGFNTDTDSLKFGIVSVYNIGKRSIVIGYPKDVEVSVFAEGEPLSDWISFQPQKFSLKAGENITIDVVAEVPGNTVEDNYTAKVYFCFVE